MINKQLFEFKSTFNNKLEDYFDKKIEEAIENGETSKDMLNVLKEVNIC